jgi:hypothetical protein
MTVYIRTNHVSPQCSILWAKDDALARAMGKAEYSGHVRGTSRLSVTSHIAWEWRCAYMYKCTLYDTTRFKAVMAMNLSELRS